MDDDAVLLGYEDGDRFVHSECADRAIKDGKAEKTDYGFQLLAKPTTTDPTKQP